MEDIALSTKYKSKYRSRIYWSWKNISGSIVRIIQTLVRGWNDSDCWNLYQNIADFTLPRLRRLKEINHGMPVLDMDSNGNEISRERINDQTNGEDNYFDDNVKEWHKIQDKMIRAFELIIDDGESLEHPDWDWFSVPCKDRTDCSKMITYNRDEKGWKKYMEDRRLQQEEKNLGLKLFGHYLENLWD